MNYTIKNSYLQVEAKSFGAELCSIKRLSDEKELLWNGNEKFWNRQAPILFPIVGKLKEYTYIYEDSEYQLSQHGFARDMQFRLVEQTDTSISFKLQASTATKKYYPFDFELIISYTLDKNRIYTKFSVKNSSDSKKLHFSIGAHPAFNWPFEEGEKEDYYIEFPLDDKLFVKRLKNGYISEGETEELSLQDNKLYLNNDLFEKDALILDACESRSVVYKKEQSKDYIKVDFNGFPYLGIWSKSKEASFVCIEPWCGVADYESHNKILSQKEGIETLDIGEVFDREFTIEIGLNDEKKQSNEELIEEEIKRINTILDKEKTNEEKRSNPLRIF